MVPHGSAVASAKPRVAACKSSRRRIKTFDRNEGRLDSFPCYNAGRVREQDAQVADSHK